MTDELKEMRPMKDILEEASRSWGWNNLQVQHNEANDCHFLQSFYTLDENSYSLYLEGFNKSHWVKITLYSQIIIPDARKTDTCVVLNQINQYSMPGSLTLTDDKQTKYSHFVDTEDIIVGTKFLENMFAGARWAFRPATVRALGALAYTKVSVQEIIAQFEAGL